MELSQQNCEACRVGAPLVPKDQYPELLAEVPKWYVEPRDEVSTLERVYSFNSYPESLRFTQQVGELAELNAHHPLLVTEWGRVTVCWWSHKARGIHQNDFIMAAKTDEIYKAY